jgi:ABC-2 type transport system ATP-binding protein
MEIIIKDLTKAYGNKIALKDINLIIGEGMYGLLGPNGAGKTTLIRILTTLLNKSTGAVTINGTSIDNKKQIRKIIGYLPQDFSIYPSLSVYEAMDYLALLSEIKPEAVRKKIILELLEKVNLQGNLKTKVKALSGGMKRRLGIAQALLNNPELLIVDEPTAGLDPEERIRFRNLLSNFASDRTVILSTHIASDIEYACEKLAVLKEGSLIYDGKVSRLVEQAHGNVWLVNVERKQWETQRSQFNIEDSKVLSSVLEGERVRLRVLSVEKPTSNAEKSQPTVEDAYMKLMSEVN